MSDQAAQPSPKRSGRLGEAIEPQRAVFYRPPDPKPVVPDGYLAVPTASYRCDQRGHWEIVMPDGIHRKYDPARRCILPYYMPDGMLALLLFEADQWPGGIYPPRPIAEEGGCR